MDGCRTCASLQGERRISPGPTIHDGAYWTVEHAYPCARLGWLVLVLKRHAEALHELTREEFAELADLTERTSTLLRRETGCQKEYLMCLAEGEGFKHIHVHLVAKPADLPAEFTGPRIFALLAVDAAHAVPPAEVTAFCERLRARFV